MKKLKSRLIDCYVPTILQKLLFCIFIIIILRFLSIFGSGRAHDKLSKQSVCNNQYISQYICQFGRPSSYSLQDTEGHTDANGNIDSTVDADQEYKCFIGLETPPSACYIHYRWA